MDISNTAIADDCSHAFHSLAAASLAADIKCCLCLGTMESPALLQCGHSFCGDCAEQAIEITKKCPMCCHPISKGAVPNLTLSAVIPAISKLLAAVRPTVPLRDQDKRPLITQSSRPTGGSASVPSRDLVVPAISPPAPEIVFHKPGDVVNVLPRLWPGINKPGGTAWVTRVNEDGTYDVKYVLGNSRDLAVPGDFVAAQGAETGHAEIGPSGRTPRKPRRSSCSDKEPSADGVCSRTSSPKGPNSEGKSSLLDKKESLPAKAPQRMSLLSSQLDDGSQNYLATFVAQFDAEIAHNYCPDVTHLVVNVNKNKVVEQRTMKYLKSMSAGKWVVSFQWILDSLSRGLACDEHDYEVLRDCKTTINHVPQLWRLAKQEYFMLQPLRKRKRGNNDREKRLPFQDVSILLYGSFPSPGPPKSDLAELLWAGGARQVTILGVVCLPLSEDAKVALVEVRGLLESTASEQQVIVCSDVQASIEFREAYRHSLHSYLENCGASINEDGADDIAIVHSIWILDCISSFSFLRVANKQYKL